ncbi:hypothetical protein O3G_MSEX014510, partial [Manduca sexta]
MVEEAVEEVLDLVKKAAQQIKPTEINPDFEFLIAEDDHQSSSGAASTSNDSTSSGQQDWSAVWECFESPHRLLSTPAGGLSKGMQEMVKNAVNEMRRYYSRKVVDVLIRVTRRSLDLVIKQFNTEALAKIDCPVKKPLFLLHAALMIPNVSVTPTLEEIQEVLVLAGKQIAGLSKGVAQWSGGKTARVSWKKIAGPQSNQLLNVVTKLDGQVQSGTPMAGTQKTMKVVDAARIKRKKHYRLESEEKPTFPFQQRNFYNHVMENKEIMKTLSLLSSCTQNIKTVSRYMFKSSRYAWAVNFKNFEIFKSHGRLTECIEAFIHCTSIYIIHRGFYTILCLSI